MVGLNELTLSQKESVKEFFDVTFCLNEEELKALDKQIPMTQEMFDHLCDRLSEIGANRQVIELMQDYPDLTAHSVQEIEKELELSGVDCPAMTEEEIKKGWDDLMERVERMG